MRNAADIQLLEAILHIVDPSRPEGLVLSERSLPLEENDRFAEYLVRHIANALADSAAIAARFTGVQPETVSAICRDLVNGGTDLTTGSRLLAERLFHVVSGDERISRGDLAVCLYQATVKHEPGRYLALLKIDPSNVFRHRTAHDVRGRLFVTFEEQQDVLPTTREKLQKCAFVRSMDPRPDDYDMILLDRQQRAARTVARFFTETFLVAVEAQDASRRTRNLLLGLYSARSQIAHELDEGQLASFDDAVESALSGGRINLDEWYATLRLPEQVVRQIDDVVTERVPDRAFELDQKEAGRRRAKRRMRGDFGLLFQVPSDHYRDVVVGEDRVVDGDRAFFRIVIHTEKWQEETL
jgi:hypothetical protein